jgi:16S rRNA (guanine(966)-N(2))-methyltransferase RsmD
VFSILQPELEQARVLDLCAGTGAMGIEALSRGAVWVTFVDSWDTAIRTLKQNLRSCGVDSGYDILADDVLVALNRLARWGETFDFIFFDPPYASDLYQPVMEVLGQGQLLKPSGLVLVMHHAKNRLPESYGKLRRARELRQGENILSFYILD